MDFLSMGMSGDYMTAIDRGANMVRLGTAISARAIRQGGLDLPRTGADSRSIFAPWCLYDHTGYIPARPAESDHYDFEALTSWVSWTNLENLTQPYDEDDF